MNDQEHTIMKLFLVPTFIPGYLSNFQDITDEREKNFSRVRRLEDIAQYDKIFRLNVPPPAPIHRAMSADTLPISDGEDTDLEE